MNLKNKRLRYAFFVTRLLVSSFHKYQKGTNILWFHNDVIIADFAKIGDLQWNIVQNRIFRQKGSKYRNFTGVFAYKRKKWRSHITL